MDVTHQASPARPFLLPADAVRTLMWRLEESDAYTQLASALQVDAVDSAVPRFLSSSGLAGSRHVSLARLGYDLARTNVRLSSQTVAEIQRRQADAEGARRSGALDAWPGAFGLLSSVAGVLASWGAASPRAGDQPAAAGRMAEAAASDEADAERAAGVWAAGEAGASLAFAAARALDVSACRAGEREAALASRGAASGEGRRKALENTEEDAVELVDLGRRPASKRDHDRWFALQADRVVQSVLADALAGVLAPASCLWMATRGCLAVSELRSLPRAPEGAGTGPLGLDAGRPIEVRAARRFLADAMTEPVFLALYRSWIGEMREIASRRPGTGACTIATAMQLWLWTLAYVSRDEQRREQECSSFFHADTLALADALSWLLAARSLVLDLVELSGRSPGVAALGRDAGGALPVLTDLCHAETARAAGEVGRVAAELVCGSIRHPAWDADACGQCYQADDLEALEDLVPGFAGSAGAGSDVIAADGSHPAKAGPCVRFSGIDAFTRLRAKLDGCLAGSRLARRRVADAIRGLS